MWEAVANETRRAFEAKDRSGTSLKCLSYGWYRIMTECDQIVHASLQYIAEEDVFHVTRWSNITRAKTDDMDDCAIDEKAGVVIDD